MSQIIAGFLIMFGLGSLGSGISVGLGKVSDSIMASQGYVRECSGAWYARDCQWTLAERSKEEK